MYAHANTGVSRSTLLGVSGRANSGFARYTSISPSELSGVESASGVSAAAAGLTDRNRERHLSTILFV